MKIKIGTYKVLWYWCDACGDLHGGDPADPYQRAWHEAFAS